MFIGHFGLGFGAKKIAPSVSLGLLFMAVQFVDLIWPDLLLLNIEHVAIATGTTRMTPLDFVDYPITHSLLAAIGWGALFGIAYWLVRKRINPAIILGLCVISHWVLDLLVHRPDLPLYPGGAARLGFGLWDLPVLETVIEAGIFIAGFVIYYRNTAAKNAVGSIGLWVLAALLVLVQVSNIFGPPPPDVTTLAWMGHAQWIFVLLAFWVDHNRRIKQENLTTDEEDKHR